MIAIEDGLKEIRQKLLRETTWLAEQIGNRSGIDLAFVAHEGLVMAANGRLENHENYAAIANQFATEAIEVAKRLELEPPGQVLMVARNRKLALIFVEEMILGIVAPREIELATLLAQV
jgi:predicted regulator of Ras-like GTPase activity (Roadblock/LC7/MglB family)